MSVLINQIEQFCEKYRSKRIGIFLHTSVVQEQSEDLKNLRSYSKQIRYYLPHDTVSELSLLSKYSNLEYYRTKGRLLLEGQAKQINLTWNQIVEYKTNICYLLDIDVALFVFFEPAAAIDFNKRMGDTKNTYVLSVDIYDTDNNVSLVTTGSSIKRKACKPLNLDFNEYIFGENDILEVIDKDKSIIDKYSLSDLEEVTCGGESILYMHPNKKNTLVKIFWFELSEEMHRKLKLLMQCADMLVKVVLPDALIYHKNRCVGYEMRRIDGKSLGNYLSTRNSVSFSKDLICNISVLLLELRMSQFVVSDLSDGNIFVENNGKNITVIDADSAEYYCFPGGGATPPYAHPDLSIDYFYKKYRLYEHLMFSFSVLLFQILMGYRNPLLQKNLTDVNSAWKMKKFPLSNSIFGRAKEARGAKVNQDCLENWRNQPVLVRKRFVEVFTFKSIPSIGEWMSTLKFV